MVLNLGFLLRLSDLDFLFSCLEDSETDSVGAGAIAAESGVKQLVLCHQGLTLEKPELKAKAIEEIKNNYSGPIIWGEELMNIPWGKSEKLLDLS